MAYRFRLSGATRALEALEDPQALEQARSRFSHSPPAYRSWSTDSDATQPDTPPGGYPGVPRVQVPESLRDKRMKLDAQRRASRPDSLFDLESRRVTREIRSAKPGYDSGEPGEMASLFDIHLAKEIIKQRWIDQGIWRDQWNRPDGWHWFVDDNQWKHEEPVQEYIEPEAQARTSLFSNPDPAPKQRKSDEEIQRLKREREASRPFYRFIYQVSIERRHILEGAAWPNETMWNGAGLEETGPHGAEPNTAAAPNLDDINTRAYEIVKARWIDFGIWKKTWGILPGMSWKHEHPLEDLLRVELPEALALSPLWPARKPEADTQTTGVQTGSQSGLPPWELTHEGRSRAEEWSKAMERLEQRHQKEWAEKKRREVEKYLAYLEAQPVQDRPKGIFSSWEPPDNRSSLGSSPSEQSPDELDSAESADHDRSRKHETEGRKRKAADEPVFAQETSRPGLFSSSPPDDPDRLPVVGTQADDELPEVSVSAGPVDQAPTSMERPHEAGETRKRSRVGRQQQLGNNDSRLPPNDNQAVVTAEPGGHSPLLPEVASTPVRRNLRARNAKRTPASNPNDSSPARKRPKRTGSAAAAAAAAAEPEARRSPGPQVAAFTPGGRVLRPRRAQKTAADDHDNNAEPAARNPAGSSPARRQGRKQAGKAAATAPKSGAPAAAKPRGVSKRGRGRPARQRG